MNSLSDAIKEAFAIAPSNVVVLHTLTVEQEGVQDPVYLVQSRGTVEAVDENGFTRSYRPSGFAFSLPPSNEEGFRNLNITIDNTTREVSDFIDVAKGSMVPITITYRPYLSTDLTTPHMIPPLVLYLKDVQITANTVSGKATFMDIVNKKFPSEIYTREKFPTLA